MERLLFLHIPKTAGTSLKRFLYHQLPAQDCLLDPPQPATLNHGLPDQYRLVAGHLDYDFVNRFGQRPFVLTCLRNPIDRALSAYYYQRTPRLAIEIRSIAAQIGEAFAAEVLEDLRRVNLYPTLREFLRAEPELARKTLGNIQTEYLAGALAVARHRSEPGRLLAIARQHLEACDGLLLAERLPETLGLVSNGWGDRARSSLRSDNTTPGRQALRDHTPEELDALAEITTLDRDLYRYAEQLIEQRAAAARTPFAFSTHLPDASNFTFDQPIDGYGWHVREFREGHWFCWSDREAALNLSLSSSGDHELHCDFRYAASPHAWAGLRITINGHPVTLTSKSESLPGRASALIPSAWIAESPRHVRITFYVEHTVRPSELDPNNPDTRRLGIAVSAVHLVPA